MTSPCRWVTPIASSWASRGTRTGGWCRAAARAWATVKPLGMGLAAGRRPPAGPLDGAAAKCTPWGPRPIPAGRAARARPAPAPRVGEARTAWPPARRGRGARRPGRRGPSGPGHAPGRWSGRRGWRGPLVAVRPAVRPGRRAGRPPAPPSRTAVVAAARASGRHDPAPDRRRPSQPVITLQIVGVDQSPLGSCGRRRPLSRADGRRPVTGRHVEDHSAADRLPTGRPPRHVPGCRPPRQRAPGSPRRTQPRSPGACVPGPRARARLHPVLAAAHMGAHRSPAGSPRRRVRRAPPARRPPPGSGASAAVPGGSPPTEWRGPRRSG